MPTWRRLLACRLDTSCRVLEFVRLKAHLQHAVDLPSGDNALYQGMASAMPIPCRHYRALARAAFLVAKYVKQYGNFSDESTRPAFTGFCAMYSRCRVKLRLSSTRTSENPRCQTSPKYPVSLFRRKENPPLMNCITFSMAVSPPTVINKCMWLGMITKSCNRNFPAA